MKNSCTPHVSSKTVHTFHKALLSNIVQLPPCSCPGHVHNCTFSILPQGIYWTSDNLSNSLNRPTLFCCSYVDNKMKWIVVSNKCIFKWFQWYKQIKMIKYYFSIDCAVDAKIVNFLQKKAFTEILTVWTIWAHLLIEFGILNKVEYPLPQRRNLLQRLPQLIYDWQLINV